MFSSEQLALHIYKRIAYSEIYCDNLSSMYFQNLIFASPFDTTKPQRPIRGLPTNKVTKPRQILQFQISSSAVYLLISVTCCNFISIICQQYHVPSDFGHVLPILYSLYASSILCPPIVVTCTCHRNIIGLFTFPANKLLYSQEGRLSDTL